MIGTVQKHIEQYYPKCTFSEVKYIEAVPVAPALLTAVAEVNHAREKAQAILMLYVYLETTVASMRLVDQFNNVMFSTPAVGGPGWLPFLKITKGSILRVTNTTGKQIFWIAYQYLMDK